MCSAGPPCLGRKTKRRVCQIAPGASQCVSCIIAHSGNNFINTLPHTKVQLKAAYQEKLFSKNPAFGKCYPEESTIFPRSATVAKWDLPLTKLLLHTPRKSKEVPKVHVTLATLVKAVQRMHKDLQALINQYNGICHLNGSQSKFPSLESVSISLTTKIHKSPQVNCLSQGVSTCAKYLKTMKGAIQG